MNFPLSIVLRPSSLVILLAYAALVGVVSLIPCWYVMVTRVEKRVNLNSENIMSQLQSETEMLHPMNSSSANLARSLTSTIDTNTTTSTYFYDNETKVLVLAIPQNGSVSFDLNYKKKGLALMIVMMVMIIIAMLSFVFINGRALRREKHLCASLSKQMEATHEAERKNNNKSLAFASASHDIRSSLAGVMGLIEMSHELLVDANSELETNLKQMEGYTQDLLGLLNSVLDTSKIEAGKMQLEEEEFDVFNLLEDVVDLFHPVAMKKDVDLVLDPCDASVIRYSRVKGDKGKLKQVLCNLLSNAVKFTDEGHITVRAWVQKPTILQNSTTITTTDQYYSFNKLLSSLLHKKNEADDKVEDINSVQQDTYCMDFVFEVDDTGKGIPKDKYKSVFDNYVQVKETALGQGGTGLGLGIVKSLVHLMHGDIEIVDKDTNEKGTCFKFNVHLTLCESETMLDYGGDTISREDLEHGPTDTNQALAGRTIQANSSSAASTICSMSPRLDVCSSSPSPEASQVVLLIADEERRRTSKRFIESLEIEVKVVNQWEDLFDTLIKIKQKGHHNSNGQNSPKESSDLSSWSTSHDSYLKARGIPIDGNEHISSVLKKTDNGASPCFILIVIDANAGPFSELSKIVSNFKKKDLPNPCKVVWLDKPLKRSVNMETIDENDIVISKPFHGSRLFQVIKLLPEFGGGWQSNSSEAKAEGTLHVMKSSQQSSIDESSFQSGEVQILKETPQKSHVSGETQESGDSSNSKPLSGRKILLVEDNLVLQNIALKTLRDLGATDIEKCENGEEAVLLVDEGLKRENPNPPYHYILMDCQMPVMDGFEATRQIREMEKSYGVHIPIIALTALSEKITAEAGNGMDFHIVKPINRQNLLKAIRYIHTKNSDM